MAIGINWAEVWDPVWKTVWQQTAGEPPIIPPIPSTTEEEDGKNYWRKRIILDDKEFLEILPVICRAIWPD